MKNSGGQRISNDPLPYRQLFIICACRFPEPICFTILFPFIVSMVRDFKVADNEQEVGYYVGFLASSFAFAQLLTGIPWGMLSDRIGRRPVILFGLLGTTTSILLFGLSKSYMWALISRSLCGLLNGNSGVHKSMLSELTKNCSAADRTRAFSMLILVYGLASIIGPMLGGFLSHPVTNFPSIFGRGGFITDLFTEFPYFLPCFVSALICAVGWILVALFLEETLGRTTDNNTKPQASEEEALLTDNGSVSPTYNTVMDHNSSRQEEDLNRPTPPTLRESLTPAVLSICLTSGLFAYEAMFYDELFPIWTASQRDVGGLGLSADEIGIALAFSGVVTWFSQLVLLPRLTQRFGLIPLYRSTLFILIFLYICHFNVRYLYDSSTENIASGSKTWLWAGLLAVLAVKTIGYSIVSTGSVLLTNNAVRRPDSLGAVNGFSQCCAAAMRAIGPATCGIIWSAALGAESIPFWLRIQISFLYLTAVAALTYWTSRRLSPKDYETAHDREQQEREQEEEATVP